MEIYVIKSVILKSSVQISWMLYIDQLQSYQQGTNLQRETGIYWKMSKSITGT